MQRIAGYPRIFGAWFELEDSCVPIGIMQPDVVLAHPLPSFASDFKLWPSGRSTAPRYPPSRGDARSETNNEDNDGNESDPDADDAGDDDPPDALDEPDLLAEGGLEDALGGAIDLLSGVFGSAPLAEPAHGGPEAETPPPQPTEAPAASSSGQGPPASRQMEDMPGVAPAARRGAAVTFHVEGGSISYYSSKNAFEAVCQEKPHKRCVVTRTCRSKHNDADGIPLGGRPVGFLAAWLGHACQCASKEEHWSQRRFENPASERLALRKEIEKLPSGRLLLSFERPLAPGEPPEPESLAGLL